MATLLDRVLRLWLEPLAAEDAAAEAAFREIYADPVPVNGAELSALDLVARARALQGALADLEIEVVDRVETPDKIVVAFRMRGRHVGPLTTPLGTVAATGRTVENRVTDILTVSDGMVTDVWMTADELGLLMQVDGVAPRPA